MHSIDTKKTISFLLPLLILITAFFALPRVSALPVPRLELVTAAPYLSAAAGMLLSIHFHRGRPFFALLLQTIFYWSYRRFLGDGIHETISLQILYACALFLPLDYVYFACIRERGIFTEAGAKRLGLLAGQAVFAYWLFRYNYAGFEPLITKRLFQFKAMNSFALPLPLILVTFCALCAIGYLTLSRQGPIENGLFSSLAALFISCNWIETPYIPAVFCTAGGVIITLSILQDSYNMAFRDDLTGIPSRRALNERLHSIGNRYAIAMLDIDHFKNFNDTYGHDVGDQVLKLVAKKMTLVGGGGTAYRYGGEEFAILFPGGSAEEAAQHLDELRRVIADYQLSIRSGNRPDDARQGKTQRGNSSRAGSTSVTVSIGVAEKDEQLHSPEEVMKAADTALYSAKNSGRNQVCSHKGKQTRSLSRKKLRA